MIRVESIRIEEFRGIRDLTLNFNGKNFAICGPNGTGKSGIVDALEFALTGNISRLSGKGMGGMSVKDHGPHVDSRNRPDKARVTLTITIPRLSKKVSIARTVKTSDKPAYKPNDSDVIQVLQQVADHPEFALSRRELIRYVISTPGDRAKEVQILLRLDRVEQLRATLQKIANAATREVAPLERSRDQARDHLIRALDLTQLTTESILAAANTRRKTLGLPSIEALTSTSSLRDGLAAATSSTPASRIAKTQAGADLTRLRSMLARLGEDTAATTRNVLLEQLTELASDPAVSDSVTRERFLQTALEVFDDKQCPVCDMPWDAKELRALVENKLTHFDAIKRKRVAAERQLEPLIATLAGIGDLVVLAERYNGLLKRPPSGPLGELKSALNASRSCMEAFLPLSETMDALHNFAQIPAAALADLLEIEGAIAALPEPTDQDAARDYLTIGQERLENYRTVLAQLKQAQERASLCRRVYEVYAQVSTEALNGIYQKVEKDFSELYRFVNRDDEAKFTAQLTPSIGKLGFDVDFYGRGKFPPGAYHSEGHQDTMGLCLYLSLMKHLSGSDFTFAVLDDVLMSIDASHRREVCNLLKERFPDTQFILTTHDPIWLRHMQTVGLVASRSCTNFRGWNVDDGPTEWDDRDIWQELEDTLNHNDVRSAAGLLRHYLEYASTRSAMLCERELNFVVTHGLSWVICCPALLVVFERC